MNKIINGKSYDTKTATLLASYQYLNEICDNYFREGLYQSSQDEYFLYCKGGSTSPYSEIFDGAFTDGCRITALTPSQAKTWAKEKSKNDYDKIFGEMDKG